MFHKVFRIKFKHKDEVGTIREGKYIDGTLAVSFLSSSDEGAFVLSVNLADHGHHAPENHFWVKNYSEGEGMAKAIQEAGIATPVRVTPPFGPHKTTATLMKLTAA